jgi:hypothetical protein
MHTALIFKEQAKVKGSGLREKGLDRSHYSIQHIEGYDLLCYKGNTQDLHSSINETKTQITVLITRTEQNRKYYQEYHDMA